MKIDIFVVTFYAPNKSEQSEQKIYLLEINRKRYKQKRRKNNCEIQGMKILFA